MQNVSKTIPLLADGLLLTCLAVQRNYSGLGLFLIYSYCLLSKCCLIFPCISTILSINQSIFICIRQ